MPNKPSDYKTNIRYRMRKLQLRHNMVDWVLILSTLSIISIVIYIVVAPIFLGIGGFGPKTNIIATVKSKHTDLHHFMVTTDKGTFEIDNGVILNIYNSDQIYGNLIVDHAYRISLEGNTVVGYFFQEYPYVINAEEICSK